MTKVEDLFLSTKGKRIYRQNIEIISEFYSSDFYLKIIDSNTNKYTHVDYIIKGIIQGMYLDPDCYDEQLLEDCINKLNLDDDIKKSITYSLDGLCGWKQLYDYHNGNIKWLDDYRIIRGSRCGNLLWPSRIMKGGQSINQERYLVFGDRIDYTLYDIKLYFKGDDKCRLKRSYENPETGKFLNSFRKYRHMDNPFLNFVEYMGLKGFTDENDVLDLDFPLSERKHISENKHEEYSFCARKPKKMEKQYLENILAICERDTKV